TRVEYQFVEVGAAVVNDAAAEQGRAVGVADAQHVVAGQAVERERGDAVQRGGVAVENEGDVAGAAAWGLEQRQRVVAGGAVDDDVTANRGGVVQRDLAAAEVLDQDADREGAGGGVGVRTVDGERAAAVGGEGGRRGEAIAPVDAAREVA